MDKKRKEELLKERLKMLKSNLETASFCINTAIESLNSLDDFNDLIHNWDKYKDIFKE